MKLSIEQEKIKHLLKKLEEIKIMSSEDSIKLQIDELIEETKSYIEYIDEEPIANEIYKKMKETKIKNPELNLNLFILYRNLNLGKISEYEAREIFEKYLQLELLEDI